ncbi:cinnamoyl-CoA reductase 2-like isoform X2 [Apium graveolens]|uniref:cinnamoyl-CoA reductase 2-like isoform X2 n=1 Tax=Apium graveolens TaxID=4045 RepID=UPI003D7A9359
MQPSKIFMMKMKQSIWKLWKSISHIVSVSFKSIFLIMSLLLEPLLVLLVSFTLLLHASSTKLLIPSPILQKEIMEPAIEGTKFVLMAAKELGVKRLVITSSSVAIGPIPSWPADLIKNEDCWTDVEYCKQNKLWYPAAKTLAEKAAWEVAEEENLDVVVVNPGAAMGAILPPTINSSMSLMLRLLQGCTETYDEVYMGSVHVKDVALAHILVYENPSAKGRHLCIESICHFSDFAAKVTEMYPEYQLPSLPKDTQPGLLRWKDPSKKLMDLGLQLTSVEQIIKDSVESLKSKGFIS